MTSSAARCLVLRLAGPVQSWGTQSRFNRRETAGEPTKSGLIGLLAAAQGRRREDGIEDLLSLALGVRGDQAGTLLRDFHTVSDYRGRGLPTAAVDGRGRQKRRSSAASHLTYRYYLQDAVFVAAVEAPGPVLDGLVEAIRRPAFPLALGRRACPPAQPLLVRTAEGDDTWAGSVPEVLGSVPWQAGPAQRRAAERRRPRPRIIDLPVTVDDPAGDDVRMDLPTTFDPRERGFRTRRVRQTWVQLPPPYKVEAAAVEDPHDPFALLGW